MKNGEKPIVNPWVVLREEFDDWAVLFNPDTGRGFGLSPIGVYLWKLLDGEHTTDDLLKEILSCADDVPEEALEHIGTFIGELAAEGLAGFGNTGSDLPAREKRQESFPSLPSGHICELKSLTYDPPKLIDLNGRRQTAYGNCMSGTDDTGVCHTGPTASYCEAHGNSPSHTNCLPGGSTIAECNYGTCANAMCDTGGQPFGACVGVGLTFTCGTGTTGC